MGIFFFVNLKKQTQFAITRGVMDGFSKLKNRYIIMINRASLAIVVPMLERENRAQEQHYYKRNTRWNLCYLYSKIVTL